MVSFQTKNTNLGKFWRALDWKTLIYFMAIWNILQTFGILYDHLIHFVFIWYIFSVSLIFTKKNLATLLSQPKKSRRRTGTMLQTSDQGDQIGRISANRAIVYFWTVFLKKIKKATQIFGLLFSTKVVY
jgi:hypothetical protein